MGRPAAVRTSESKTVMIADRGEITLRIVRTATEVAGRALSAATIFELDDVIDPAESRVWIASLSQR